MIEDSILADIASIMAGFGSAMLFFRIDRELRMSEKNEVTWIPWADWLLLSATLTSLLLVIFPMVALSPRPSILQNLPAAGCSAASIMIAGYIFGILAHYRLIFGKNRSGPRDNPEPAERRSVILAAVLAIVAFCIVLFGIL
jgi:hypothetical protein